MIELKICQGTTCYIMGGAQLATLATSLPDDLKDIVHVTGCRCLNLCQTSDFGSPYVTVDGEVIGKATPESVIAALRERAAAVEK